MGPISKFLTFHKKGLTSAAAAIQKPLDNTKLQTAEQLEQRILTTLFRSQKSTFRNQVTGNET